jgi:acyl-coenzyme A thioesterase 9
MREAFELGWLGAYLHVKGVCYPEIFHIDDVQFLAPVDIGTTLSIRSRVTYI